MNIATASVTSATAGGASLPAKAAFRVAIVGCGPRGLYCLERLSKSLRRHPSGGSIAIDLFDPSPSLGSGSDYDPALPRFYRTHFPVADVDAWHPDPNERYHADLTLAEWLVDRYPQHADPDGCIPRAIVGEYLQWCFQQVIGDLREVAPVQVHRQTVDQIDRAGSKWRVQSGASFLICDEVMLTVGRRAGRDASQSVPTNGDVHMSSESLDERAVPSGSNVAIRGFGPRWLDTAFLFSEGRGGRFGLDQSRWTYERSGREPAMLYPFSRSGRPMLARPSRQNEADLAELWDHYRIRLQAIPKSSGGHDFRNVIWPVVTEAANQVLCRASGCSRADTAAWFRGWSRWRLSGHLVTAALQRSYDVAVGRRPMDERSALATTWQHLYPTLVRDLSHGGLAERSGPSFRRIAREMERLAFGPPADTVGRLLALHEEGLVDFNFLSGSQVNRSSDGSLRMQRFDEKRMIDHLVIPNRSEPLGVGADGLLQQLVESGLVESPGEDSGFFVDRGGRLRAPDGNFLTGLSLIGRATEGCVLGNERLSRRLHCHVDCWVQLIERHYLHRRLSA